MNQLILRTQATERTVTEVLRKPFTWDNEGVDCVRMIITHLKNMGHPFPLKGLTSWTSEKGALRVFRAAEISDLGEGLDRAGYARIPLAQKLVGDVLGFEGPDPWKVALGVYVGNGQALAMAYGQALVGSVTPAQICWRVDPCLN